MIQTAENGPGLLSGRAVVRIQEQRNVYRCSRCPRSFFDKDVYSKHQKVHGIVKQSESSKKKDTAKPFACHRCRKKYKKKGYLKMHIKIHDIEDAKRSQENGILVESSKPSCERSLFDPKPATSVDKSTNHRRDNGTDKKWTKSVKFLDDPKFLQKAEINRTADSLKTVNHKKNVLKEGSDVAPIQRQLPRSRDSSVFNMELQPGVQKRQERKSCIKKRGGYFVCLVCKKTFMRRNDALAHSLIHNEDMIKAFTKKTSFSRTLAKGKVANGGLQSLFSKASRRSTELRGVEAGITELGWSQGARGFVDSKRGDSQKSKPTSVGTCSSTNKGIDVVKKSWTCEICNKYFTFQCKLRQHLKIHIYKKPFCCPTCMMHFNKLWKLNKHRLLKHQPKTKTGRKCPFCPKIFNDGGLYYHKKTHTRQKPFICSVCKVKFSDLAHLKAHGKKHRSSGNKNFKCASCPRTFLSERGLVYHQRLHQDGQRSTRNTFDSNVETMMFTCSACSRTFTREESLRLHSLKHNGLPEQFHEKGSEDSRLAKEKPNSDLAVTSKVPKEVGHDRTRTAVRELEKRKTVKATTLKIPKETTSHQKECDNMTKKGTGVISQEPKGVKLTTCKQKKSTQLLNPAPSQDDPESRTKNCSAGITVRSDDPPVSSTDVTSRKCQDQRVPQTAARPEETAEVADPCPFKDMSLSTVGSLRNYFLKDYRKSSHSCPFCKTFSTIFFELNKIKTVRESLTFDSDAIDLSLPRPGSVPNTDNVAHLDTPVSMQSPLNSPAVSVETHSSGYSSLPNGDSPRNETPFPRPEHANRSLLNIASVMSSSEGSHSWKEASSTPTTVALQPDTTSEPVRNTSQVPSSQVNLTRREVSCNNSQQSAPQHRPQYLPANNSAMNVSHAEYQQEVPQSRENPRASTSAPANTQMETNTRPFSTNQITSSPIPQSYGASFSTGTQDTAQYSQQQQPRKSGNVSQVLPQADASSFVSSAGQSSHAPAYDTTAYPGLQMYERSHKAKQPLSQNTSRTGGIGNSPGAISTQGHYHSNPFQHRSNYQQYPSAFPGQQAYRVDNSPYYNSSLAYWLSVQGNLAQRQMALLNRATLHYPPGNPAAYQNNGNVRWNYSVQNDPRNNTWRYF